MHLSVYIYIYIVSDDEYFRVEILCTLCTFQCLMCAMTPMQQRLFGKPLLGLNQLAKLIKVS